MGETIVYHCPKCGKHHPVSIGAFFMSPASAEEILAGSRGIQAKRNLERHPGNNAMFTHEVFRCNCGYARSKLVMVIFGDDKVPWDMSPHRDVVWHNARCRCPRCGRSMHVVEEPPRKIRCTCGSWTEDYDVHCLFD